MEKKFEGNTKKTLKNLTFDKNIDCFFIKLRVEEKYSI